MEEAPPEGQSVHVAATTRRTTVEIDPAELRIKFRPHVLERLRELIEAVHLNEGAAPRRLVGNLEKLASGKTNVVDGLRLMADITEEIEDYARNSRDYGPQMSWRSFVSGLYHRQTRLAQPILAQPILLVAKERGRGLT